MNWPEIPAAYLYYTVAMRLASLVGTLALLIPSLAAAATFGFPDQPLWVSATTAEEGQTITMYAAVYNSSDAELKGTISFLADDEVFNTKDVTLGAGDSQLVTNGWKAVKGSHSLSATFTAGSEKESTTKIAVTVTDAPPPPPAEPTIVDKTVDTASDFVSDMTTSVPIVGTVADAIINQTEKVREAGADFLEPYAKPAPPIASVEKSSLTDTAVSYGKMGLQLAAAAALFAFDTKWLFYILTIALLVYILRTLKNWVNRPRF